MKSNNTLVEGKYFRVYPITRVVEIDRNDNIITQDMNIKEGLGIEKRDFENNYFVVAFVKPKFFLNEFVDVIFEDVDFRSVFELDATKPDMIEEFKNCVAFARNAIRDVYED